MSTASFIAEARRITRRLAELDLRRVAFGASKHRYAFAPPLAESAVASFERRCGLELPAPYRAFLTQLGNGGAGPFYGVAPLALDSQVAARPWPHVDGSEPAEENEFDAELDGMVSLAEYGCGIFVMLVVKGAAAGQVFWDARYEGGIKPVLDGPNQRMGFDGWWLAGMRRVLDRFERIAALMENRVPHEEIHATLEPGILQLDVDETLASLMNREPSGTPRQVPKKAWGLICGQVDELYDRWLRARK